MSWSRWRGWQAPPRSEQEFTEWGWEKRRSYNPEEFRRLFCTRNEHRIMWFYKDPCWWGLRSNLEWKCQVAVRVITGGGQ